MYPNFVSLCIMELDLAGLTPAGVAHSWLLGTLVYAAFGPGGYLLVCLYFLLGSAVSLSVNMFDRHVATAAVLIVMSVVIMKTRIGD